MMNQGNIQDEQLKKQYLQRLMADYMQQSGGQMPIPNQDIEMAKGSMESDMLAPSASQPPMQNPIVQQMIPQHELFTNSPASGQGDYQKMQQQADTLLAQMNELKRRGLV